MNFKIIDKRKVLDYFNEYVDKIKFDKKRLNNIWDIIDNITYGSWKVLFAFENNYGEKYLCIRDRNGNDGLFGDESNWSCASSFEERRFMESYIEHNDI
jgi:hypothetical protein